MMMNFAGDAGIESLAAAEADLHCWILSLYIDRHGFGVELLVFVSVTHSISSRTSLSPHCSVKTAPGCDRDHQSFKGNRMIFGVCVTVALKRLRRNAGHSAPSASETSGMSAFDQRRRTTVHPVLNAVRYTYESERVEIGHSLRPRQYRPHRAAYPLMTSLHDRFQTAGAVRHVAA